MQWYVNLITIAATGVLGWATLEFLWRPIRAFFDLRYQVHLQMLALGNISFPRPRETAVSSREIHEYNDALKNVREAQRIFRDLGSQMLAFGESERAACEVLAAFGLHPVAAGGGLIGLSLSYGHHDAEWAGFRDHIEKALRFTDVAPAAWPLSRRPRLFHGLLEPLLQRNNILRAASHAIGSPRVHQLAAFFQRIAGTIGLFSRIADDVTKRCVGYITRKA